MGPLWLPIPTSTSTSSPAPTIHGLGGPIRCIVGEPCLGDRYSGERMRGVDPCGRPSDVSTLIAARLGGGCRPRVGPCGHPSDVSTPTTQIIDSYGLVFVGPCGDPVWGTGNPSDVSTPISFFERYCAVVRYY